MNHPAQEPVLVVGAGIAGVTAALEAAEAGQAVILVEREPAIGGRVLRLHNYFPKLCPPACGGKVRPLRGWSIGGESMQNERIERFVTPSAVSPRRGRVASGDGRFALER